MHECWEKAASRDPRSGNSVFMEFVMDDSKNSTTYIGGVLNFCFPLPSIPGNTHALDKDTIDQFLLDLRQNRRRARADDLIGPLAVTMKAVCGLTFKFNKCPSCNMETC